MPPEGDKHHRLPTPASQHRIGNFARPRHWAEPETQFCSGVG
jgi:hypothetical protein